MLYGVKVSYKRDKLIFTTKLQPPYISEFLSRDHVVLAKSQLFSLCVFLCVYRKSLLR